MKKLIIFVFLFFSSFVFSQQEASNWYFGNHAGLKFHPDGTVTALTDGQLKTLEGCASLSDSNGNLLFYTDGTTVYNKKHEIMLNGTNLKGDNSSTQSATIVQKPGDSNLFYLFTITARAESDGFRYSIIDLNLDNGLGGITSKNIPIYSPTCEKISVIKHSNNSDFWIVTHGWGNNTFFAHLLTNAGINTIPVASNSGTSVLIDSDGYNTMGYMKIAPNGKKIAICHEFIGTFEINDFDNSSGIVSNQKIIYKTQRSYDAYGVEFSPNSNVLYLSLISSKEIYQFDLTSPDVASSSKLIAKAPTYLGALQLGPNNKIYIANYESTNLGVINDPNKIGIACDLQTSAIDLGSRKSLLGLPSFNQSFFNPTFSIKNLCLGSTTEFNLDGNKGVTTATWNFGDGSTSTDISPTHTYATAGTYTVSVTATSGSNTVTKTRDVTISAIPTATKPQDLLVCDSNNVGFYNFDLTKQNPAILNGQAPNTNVVKYFANASDYANNIAITTPNNYVNTKPYQAQTIIAEVSSNVNSECKSSTFFNIDVFDLPKPNTIISKISSCDNTSVGTDTDGRVLFDLTQNSITILNGQSASQFALSFYKDSAFTQLIATPNAYANTNISEIIYVKMVNNDNLNCFATTSFSIEVFSLPVISNVVSLKQCDDNIDGFTVFNLEEAISKITSNAHNETIIFYKSLTDAQNNSDPIINPSIYRNQMVTNDVVYAKVSNANTCFQIAKINLFVSTTQIPLSYSKTLTECDDTILGSNTDGIASFDFSSVTTEIQNIFPSGQLLDINYYQNLADALAEKNAIKDILNYRNIGYPFTQKIYIRVDNKLNNDCIGLGAHITLNVEKIPIVQALTQTHCDDDQDGKFTFDTTNLQNQLLNGLTNATVNYSDENNVQLSSPLPNPFLTASQTLKVVVLNNTTKACSYNSTIKFIVDDLPEAFNVPISSTTTCDDEANPVLQDGKYAFDTSTFQNLILGNQTGMNVKYFDTNNNALPSPLPNSFITETQNVRVEVINTANTTCIAAKTLAFVVNPVPKITLNGDQLVCSNLPRFTKDLDAGLLDGSPKTNYAYTWTFNGNSITGETNPTLTVNTAGIYTTTVTNNKGCSMTRMFTVQASDKAKITDVKVIDLAELNSITISVAASLGNYVYALDDEISGFQTENVFTNINSGIHTIYIKDLNGCGITTKEVAVLGIPTFFTPNNDGVNDYWNIKGISTNVNNQTIIYVFDRYGKLLKQINPLHEGWDGRLDGQQLPSDDYWYSLTLQDGRVLKGHFTLKR